MKNILRALVLFLGFSGFAPSGLAEIYYVHSDHLGTPTKLTDSAKRVVWSASNRGFGEGIYSADPDGDGHKVDMPLRYPGQYYDKESGLHYNYFRYYDPTVGRYITSDPIGLVGGVNTYEYALGNPVQFSDPFGLWSLNISLYRGIGGQVTLGYADGKGFLYGGLGWGLQGGVSFDPSGNFVRPEKVDVRSCVNVVEEFFAPTFQAGFQVGPLNAGYTGYTGGYYNPKDGYTFIEGGSIDPSYSSFGLSGGISLSPIYGGFAVPVREIGNLLW